MPRRTLKFLPFNPLLVSALLAVPLRAAAVSAFDDDFNDNATGAQWDAVTDAPGQLDLVEANGRLEAIANAPTNPTFDALYLSSSPQGFRLKTDADFRVDLNYHFSSGAIDSSTASNGDALSLVFGIGRDLEGTDSAAIGIAISKQSLLGGSVVGTAVVGASRTDDVQSEQVLSVFPNTDGTLRVTYDATLDRLQLFMTAFGGALTLDNTVAGAWNADALFVSFGVRGNGFTLDSGDAYFDNFTIFSGNIEPNCIAGDYNGDGFVSQADLDLVLLSWGDTVPPAGWVKPWPPADEPGVPIISQNELDGVLLNWGAGTPPVLPASRPVPEPGLLGLVSGVTLLIRRRGQLRAAAPD